MDRSSKMKLTYDKVDSLHERCYIKENYLDKESVKNAAYGHIIRELPYLSYEEKAIVDNAIEQLKRLYANQIGDIINELNALQIAD